MRLSPVFFSGERRAGEVVQAIRASVVDFLRSPFDRSRLHARAITALDAAIGGDKERLSHLPQSGQLGLSKAHQRFLMQIIFLCTAFVLSILAAFQFLGNHPYLPRRSW